MYYLLGALSPCHNNAIEGGKGGNVCSCKWLHVCMRIIHLYIHIYIYVYNIYIYKYIYVFCFNIYIGLHIHIHTSICAHIVPTAQHSHDPRTDQKLLDEGKVLQPPKDTRKARKLRADLRVLQDICSDAETPATAPLSDAAPSAGETEKVLEAARDFLHAGQAFHADGQKLLSDGWELIRACTSSLPASQSESWHGSTRWICQYETTNLSFCQRVSVKGGCSLDGCMRIRIDCGVFARPWSWACALCQALPMSLSKTHIHKNLRKSMSFTFSEAQTLQKPMTWHAMLWYDIVWYDKIWHAMLWYDAQT